MLGLNHLIHWDSSLDGFLKWWTWRSSKNGCYWDLDLGWQRRAGSMPVAKRAGRSSKTPSNQSVAPAGWVNVWEAANDMRNQREPTIQKGFCMLTNHLGHLGYFWTLIYHRYILGCLGYDFSIWFWYPHIRHWQTHQYHQLIDLFGMIT